jgi:sporulation protein YlmC with PRC-barrel domain
MKTTLSFWSVLLLATSGAVIAQQPEEQPGAAQPPAQAQEQPPAQAQEQPPAQAQEQPPAQAQAPAQSPEQPAQPQPAQAEQETRVATAGQQEGGFISAPQPEQMRTDELEGSDVLDGEGNNVGKVRGLLIDENGETAGLLVRVGGIAGVGGKTVAVPWSAATIEPRQDGKRGYTVQTQMTRQQFGAAPEFSGP